MDYGLLVFVMISIFFCGSALLLGTSRLVYAFAHDGAMPFFNTAYEAIVSVNTIGSQMSYLVPILPRITKSRTKFVFDPFSLGKFSITCSVISSCRPIFTCAQFIVPTEAPIIADNMNYAIVLFATIMICSMTYFYFGNCEWFTGPVRVIDGQQAILDDEPIRSSSSEANKE